MNIQTIKKWLVDRRVLAALYILLGLVSALTKLSPARHNNFNVFRYVFYHTWDGTSLYAEATDGGYWDINHYDPVFSLVIAPFAVVPEWLGLVLWCTCLAVFLYWAISKYCSLPRGVMADRGVTANRGTVMQPFIIWFCAHELLTALFMQQFNVAIAAIILLSYYFVEKGREEYSAFFIVVGTMVKIYGIVGLAFFFFAKNKKKFVAALIAWSVVLFLLPMLISSPEYQIQQYHEWMLNLGDKNGENALNVAQNISLLGIIRKALCAATGGVVVDGVWRNGGIGNYSDLWLIIPGCLAMAVGYFRVSQWKNSLFRMTVLAGVMMFVCLFSSGTESSGYIIALIGCVIWYVATPKQRSKWDIALMVLAFVVTSLSPSDLFPRYVRAEIIQPFALKALPVALIWLKLVYELITTDYSLKEDNHAVCAR